MRLLLLLFENGRLKMYRAVSAVKRIFLTHHCELNKMDLDIEIFLYVIMAVIAYTCFYWKVGSLFTDPELGKHSSSTL